jgi:hypothetical protein
MNMAIRPTEKKQAMQVTPPFAEPSGTWLLRTTGIARSQELNSTPTATTQPKGERNGSSPGTHTSHSEQSEWEQAGGFQHQNAETDGLTAKNGDLDREERGDVWLDVTTFI